MLYSLTWKVTKIVPTPCPDHVPDPYTGEYPSFHCAVYHSKTITEERIKSFETVEEALDFASEAPSSCSDFEINGERIVDTRPKPKPFEYTEGIVGSGTITIGGVASITLDNSTPLADSNGTLK